MLTFDAMIDAVQTGKKTFIKTFITNQTVADSLNKFVDAQSEYTKESMKAGMDTWTTVTKEMIKNVQDASKFDYSKFGEGIMKAYQNNFSK